MEELFRSAAADIQAITGWLETKDEHGWSSRVGLALHILNEVERAVSTTNTRRKKKSENEPRELQVVTSLRALVNAMWLRDRGQALESGKRTLNELGIILSRDVPPLAKKQSAG